MLSKILSKKVRRFFSFFTILEESLGGLREFWFLHFCILGEDPLAEVADASDVNSVAGVLKLYFRELREPIFPIFMFDQFVDCTRKFFSSSLESFFNSVSLLGCETKPEVVQKIKDLVRTLPRSFFIVMRYLFAFLNQ